MPSKYKEKVSEASRKLWVADQTINGAYGITKDPKILVGVVEHCLDAMRMGVSALINFEVDNKELEYSGNSPEIGMELLRARLAEKYGIPKEYILKISEMKEFLLDKEKSPVEFRRKEKFIVCDDKYNLNVIDEKRAREFLKTSKEFLSLIKKIIN